MGSEGDSGEMKGEVDCSEDMYFEDVRAGGIRKEKKKKRRGEKVGDIELNRGVLEDLSEVDQVEDSL